ncbi:MAG: oligoendopeptidase F [Oscillospiraceae bacterium]|nr:oligoendopeptidase F [Oscillospiraceae bacterium]
MIMGNDFNIEPMKYAKLLRARLGGAAAGGVDAGGSAADGAAAGRIPKRSEIAPEYKWKLEDMFMSDEHWERELAALLEGHKALADYRGRIAESAATLLECLTLRNDISSRCETLYAYAKMRRDEDNTNDKYQGFTDKALGLYTEVSTACSYMAPELLAAGRARIDALLGESAELAVYTHYMAELFRQQEHILSEAEEAILALAGEPLNAADDIFTMLTNADMKFPDIEDENGNIAELSEGRYIRYLENPDRGVRERAFLGLYATYTKYRNTIAASLSSSVKKDKFYSIVRKYGSSIEMSLDDDMVPVALYDRLVDTVDANLSLLRRYLRLRKRALGLPELAMYDLYAPMVASADREVTYEQAVRYVKEGLAPLGDRYLRDLDNAFAQGWIDVFENVNKTNGAYSWGTYRSHPYILMNYQNRVDDVLTLAHELGHSMHSFYTNGKQPYIYCGYKIFVAEVASTVNESLVLEHLIGGAADPAEKAYLLNRQLETIRGTLFRQTMFAAFERIIHKNALEGAALTADALSEAYKGLNDKFFADEVGVNPEIAMEWARIPHFYRAFYVYQYATGISAAMSIARRIKAEGAPAVESYMEFLASGDSDYPLELLKSTGVDFSTPAPVEGAMRAFEAALEELEKLIG